MNDIDQTALEIARAFIPVDVVGQQRANLQVAIIEAIKKHANPKTLADVQPGGRVRLGDQAERARFEAWALRECLTLHRYADGSGKYSYDRTDSAWKAWQYLSAQPSPGGQGDAQTIEKLRAMMDHSFGGPGFVVYGTEQSIAEVERRLAPGIAARQPVGEPVIDYEDLVDQAKDLIQCGCSVNGAFDWLLEQLTDGEVLASPAQAVDLGTGVKAIAAERERQLQTEGFTRDGDQQYRRGELAKAATAYVQLAAMDLEAGTRNHIAWREPAAVWPWAPEWWKPVDARRDLVRAGALIAAQIDLIDSQAVGK